MTIDRDTATAIMNIYQRIDAIEEHLQINKYAPKFTIADDYKLVEVKGTAKSVTIHNTEEDELNDILDRLMNQEEIDLLSRETIIKMRRIVMCSPHSAFLDYNHDDHS